MNSKEVLEIKKQFTPENCAVTRICGCYVDHEKVRKMEMGRSFLSLPEEEAFKYFEIFKQTLTGTVGKKLINMEFPLSQEEPGGTQEFLYRLKNSKLQDEALLDQFYNKIIDTYEYGENYFIILIHSVYDVPGKSTDGLEMFDSSDNIYEHILCSICPVTLSKAGLSYDVDQNSIVGRSRDWVVGPPMKGFLYPAFDDRTSDIHKLLYFSKKPDDLQPALIEELVGSEAPLSAKGQKETFNSIVSDTLGDNCNYMVVKNIHEHLQEMIEENQDEPEPLEITKYDMQRLLEQSGVAEKDLETLEETYHRTAGEKTSFLASNIAETKKFSIETPDVVVKINSDCADLVETRMIDNKRCLVIAINDRIAVNGVDLTQLEPVSEQE